jgi:hypothetical protein
MSGPIASSKVQLTTVGQAFVSHHVVFDTSVKFHNFAIAMYWQWPKIEKFAERTCSTAVSVAPAPIGVVHTALDQLEDLLGSILAKNVAGLRCPVRKSGDVQARGWNAQSKKSLHLSAGELPCFVIGTPSVQCRTGVVLGCTAEKSGGSRESGVQ